MTGESLYYRSDSLFKMSDYKKMLIIKIVLSIICFFALTFIVIASKNAFESKADGEIQVVYVDVEGNTISDKIIKFKEKDTLVKLLQDNYNNVVIENGMIMSFEDFNTPSDWSQFISIYVNDEMSMVGILEIEFENNTKISLIITEYVPY